MHARRECAALGWHCSYLYISSAFALYACTACDYLKNRMTCLSYVVTMFSKRPAPLYCCSFIPACLTFVRVW